LIAPRGRVGSNWRTGAPAARRESGFPISAKAHPATVLTLGRTRAAHRRWDLAWVPV